jgi:hypothetical protein
MAYSSSTPQSAHAKSTAAGNPVGPGEERTAIRDTPATFAGTAPIKIEVGAPERDAYTATERKGLRTSA